MLHIFELLYHGLLQAILILIRYGKLLSCIIFLESVLKIGLGCGQSENILFASIKELLIVNL